MTDSRRQTPAGVLSPAQTDVDCDGEPAALLRRGAAQLVRRESQEAAAAIVRGPRNLLATCVDDQHPTLRGRVQLQVTGDGPTRELWVPTLLHLPVRRGDRVVLAYLDNADEPVVMGVLDGFETRPPAPVRERAAIELAADERIGVHGAGGQPLLELCQGPSGPVVKLLSPNVCVEVPGKLEWRAESISLEATRGQVTVEASDNVIVRGEIVELN